MIKKTTKPFKVITGVGAVLLITAGIVMGSIFKAQADTETAANKLLKTCSVQSGGVIIQIGNTCTSGGQGCSPNACSATLP